MTHEKFQIAMKEIAKSIKVSDIYGDICTFIDSDGTMTDDEVFKKFVDDISSPEVFQYLTTGPSFVEIIEGYDSTEEFDNNAVKYYVIGYNDSSVSVDDVMCCEYVTINGITDAGKLIKHDTIRVSVSALDYVNTLTYNVELYKPDSNWFFELNEITQDEKSPLYKYSDFFVY